MALLDSRHPVAGARDRDKDNITLADWSGAHGGI